MKLPRVLSARAIHGLVIYAIVSLCITILSSITSCSSVPISWTRALLRLGLDKGLRLAIEVARRSGRRLLIGDMVQDSNYFEEQIAGHIDED